MQVTKLKRAQGLAPVGSYLEALARDLRAANERQAQRQAALDQEDRDLEALYRQGSAARGGIYADAAA
ncbi:MAG: hypothetical protein JNK94_02680 [Hyphomonadaceae bacterium]|nr:hypothetical protein [Hyphomonadaceae bacterium]MBX3511083.1 hypothetical protein [Hyphomonadaceae bacterium]